VGVGTVRVHAGGDSDSVGLLSVEVMQRQGGGGCWLGQERVAGHGDESVVSLQLD
jgi:hypothetical protein